MRKTALILSFYATFTLPSLAADGLALTPPMGWNSWNVFGTNIDEEQIKDIAQAMVTSGMKDAGYVYLNLDDNWMATSRDANGKLQGDPTRFPSGMKALADYIHELGLKFGLYGDRGKRTCAHVSANLENTGSGSYGKETLDAQTFAEWGIDYLKYDNCDEVKFYEREGETEDRGYDAYQKEDYKRMADALAATGKDIVFSICAWGYKTWAPEFGNLWRTTGDIENKFESVAYIIGVNSELYENTRAGHWNDPDMLEIGNGVLTLEESRTQITMWAMMAAPLLTGSDLRKLTPDVLEIYTNKDVISIDQDSAAIAGRRISANDSIEIWTRELSRNSYAVAVYNPSSKEGSATVDFKELGLSDSLQIRNVWENKLIGNVTDINPHAVKVPSHGVVLFKATPAEKIPDPVVEPASSSSQSEPASSASLTAISARINSGANQSQGKALYFDLQGNRLEKSSTKNPGAYIMYIPGTSAKVFRNK